MSSNDTCSICYFSYTTSELHRPASLECGHLFGVSCIKKWFNKSKTALCPTCLKKCRLRNLRIIYATEVIVNQNDDHLEKIWTLKKEKEILESENANLKSTIDLLQIELKKKEKKNSFKKTDFTKYKLLNRNNFNQKEKFVLMEYDFSDNIILITFKNDSFFGIKKIDV